MTPVATEPTFALRDLVREYLAASDEPDWGVIAAQICEELPEEYLRAALHEALPLLTREEARRARNEAFRGVARSGKWEQVAESLRAGVLDQRISVAGRQCFLGDLTRAEVLWVVEDYRRRAVQTVERANRFERLANLMRYHSAASVRDLGEDRVAETFNA